MDPKEIRIIREMVAAENDFVSGNTLADSLGISRVAIWGHMEKLKGQGFEFEAVRSKGYRMTQTPENLNQAMVIARLPKGASDMRIEILDAIDSTNSEAERRLANGEKTPFAIISREQTEGRGRLGRKWHSPKNGNLYMSFAFRPRISPARMSNITLWIGLNLCECLNAFCRTDAMVKWPNDIHIDGKKVAGILTEARMDADQTRDVVLGIGLNVNTRQSDWPEELRPIATSLRHETGETYDINRLASAIVGRVNQAYNRFIADEHRADLKRKWERYDALAGKTVSLVQGDAKVSGLAMGIDSHGALVLEGPDSSRFQVRAGEVSIEK